MDIITLNDLSKAIANRVGIDIEEARRDAGFVMDIFGYDDLEEFSKIPLLDHIAPASRDLIVAQLKRVAQGEIQQNNFEYEILRKDGNTRVLYACTTHMSLGGEIYTQTIFQDITERKQAEASLSEERLMLRTLIDNLPDNVFIKDRQSRFLLSNLAHIRWLRAASQEELVAKTDFDFYSKELAEKYFTDEQAVMSSGQALIGREEPSFDEAGNPRWLLTSKVPLFDTNNRIIGIVGVNHDITHRKQAEESLRALLSEKEVLLREVYHRVKNNLATIEGLLGLQQKVLSDPADLVHFQVLEDRIHSMSLVHEMLYQSESLAQIDLHQYLQRLTTHLQSSLDLVTTIHLRVEATGVEMNLDTAIPCGLIVNELVTNAFRHAFPEGRPRPEAEFCEIAVTVTWEDDSYTLVVRDNGVGLPAGLDWNATQTLGLRLVSILGQRQLRGQLELDRSGGTTFRLRFPPQSAIGR